MDNYNFYSYLAAKLENKWRNENQLPRKGHIDGLDTIYIDVQWIYDSIIYTDWMDGFQFRYYDRTGYKYIGPIIPMSEVLRELWPELEEYEKTKIMTNILSAHDN